MKITEQQIRDAVRDVADRTGYGTYNERLAQALTLVVFGVEAPLGDNPAVGARTLEEALVRAHRMGMILTSVYQFFDTGEWTATWLQSGTPPGQQPVVAFKRWRPGRGATLLEAMQNSTLVPPAAAEPKETLPIIQGSPEELGM